MDYKRNLKYFLGSDRWYYLGMAILWLGLTFFIGKMFSFRLFPYQMPIGLILTITGASMAFIPKSRCSTEEEIDAMLHIAVDAYSEEISNRLSLSQELIKNIEPITIADYIYRNDLLMRRGRIDRKCRTALCGVSKIFCIKNGLVIASRTLSLINEMNDENLFTYRFSDMDLVTVVDEEFVCKDQLKVKHSYFVIQKDSEEILRLPAKHDVKIDKFCSSINEKIIEIHEIL